MMHGNPAMLPADRHALRVMVDRSHAEMSAERRCELLSELCAEYGRRIVADSQRNERQRRVLIACAAYGAAVTLAGVAGGELVGAMMPLEMIAEAAGVDALEMRFIEPDRAAYHLRIVDAQTVTCHVLPLHGLRKSIYQALIQHFARKVELSRAN